MPSALRLTSPRLARCNVCLARCSVWLVGLLLCGAALADASDDTHRAEAAWRSGDLIVAMSLFRRAAEAGHAPAQARLADLLDAAEQDSEAVDWYRKSAEQGEAAGEYGLGRMLANGEGITRNAELALQWYRRAAEKNHAPALEALARATRSGDLGLARDVAAAAALDARAKALREPAARAAR